MSDGKLTELKEEETTLGSELEILYNWLRNDKTTRLLQSVKTETKEGCGSGWWCRKVLDSSPFMDTINLQLHMEKTPMRMT